ncbi:MAG: YihY family inner membrane protein [Sutterella sp.]|nr:YihY family inner membrane protein [Sutterella sp.]
MKQLRAASWADQLKSHRWFDSVSTLGRFAVERMKETHLQEVASSMTLTTLLSLVPLIAVSLAAFALFPSFASARQSLEEMLFQSFLPEQYTETLMNYLRDFSKHASGLGIAGVAGLAVTALLLIDKFFVTVNRIFMVRRMRPWAQRALLYWALITLGPLSIAFSLTVSGQAVRYAAEGLDPGILGWLMPLLQLAVQACGYTFLYKFVPNCHVPLKNAAVGGALVAVAGLVVREGFEYYVTAGTLGSIYGAFVALPVLLLWFYVSWILIFSGAAVTATIPLLTSGRFADSYKAGNDFLTGVAMLKVLWQEKEAGRPAVPMSLLCREADTYPLAAHRILEKLADTGYCGEITNRRANADTDWTLLCNPESATLQKAVDALLVDGSVQLVKPRDEAKNRPAGILCGWYRGFMESGVLASPIGRLFAEDREPKRE